MALDPLFDDLSIEDLRRRPGAKWRVDPDVIPSSVADMDFPVAPVIADAIEHTVRRGDLGYPKWEYVHPLRVAFADRMRERYGWAVGTADVREHTDVVQAVQVLLHLGTAPGDAVAVHTACCSAAGRSSASTVAATCGSTTPPAPPCWRRCSTGSDRWPHPDRSRIATCPPWNG